MRIFHLVLISSMLISAGQAMAQEKSKRTNKGNYEEVGFEDLLHRYFEKEKADPLEGIYSVSCVITTRTNRIFSKRERIKIVDRKDNYARVAILRDWSGTNREYIEISMSFKDAKKFPVVGEVNTIAEGNGYMYRHIEPDGTVFDFSMLNESVEQLEAEYSKMEKRKTITYRLSYLKLYPKTSQVTVSNEK
jgi:hypothetical protein